MVMETPSAQCVGREFVRQYYTLLHEAPNYLHRFYSHNSCFVHGGVEKPGEEQPPVMGQNDIHKKILDLKFKDCHAKIRQVDSQPTVGNAVVVQVTGELSNNRQPMRRFMQTFILAPQSPKKYYVHNDIFRYQDEVFHDLDGGVDSSAQQVTAELDGQDMQKEVEVEEAIPEQEPAQPEPAYYDAPQQQPPAMSNGTGQMEKAADSQEEFNAAPAEEVVEEQPAAAFEPAVEKEEEPEPAPAPVPEVPQQPQEPPKPVSWAAMASQRPAQQSAAAPQQPAVRVAPIKPAVVADAAGKQPQDAKPQPPRPPRQQRDRQRGDNRAAGAAPGAPAPAPENQDNGTAEPRQRDRVQGPPQSMYPDAVQLFVGNLPHNIEEAELKDFFEKDYGKVIDVRINRKRDRDVPVSKNFGFVIFQSAETVQKVLAQKPIMLRDIRLNVEEKKQRGEGGRPGSGTRMGGRGGRSGGGGQGGQGGMGGGPRGGGRGGAGGAPRGGQGNGRGGFGGGNRR